MSFFNEISIEKDIADFVLSETQKLAVNIDADLVRETPKDTGRAAGNWLVSIGAPTAETLAAIRSAGDAINSGINAIRTAKAYSSIFIQNNLPYIGRLNDGHSLQAPSKYVDRIIARRSAE